MSSTDREPTGGLIGLLALVAGLCCGVAVLLGTGLAIGTVGLVVGSGLLLATSGVALGTWAWRRRQRSSCAAADEQPRTPWKDDA